MMANCIFKKNTYRLFHYTWKGWNWWAVKIKFTGKMSALSWNPWDPCRLEQSKLRLAPCTFCFCPLVTWDATAGHLKDRTGHYLDLRSFLLFSMVFSLSPLHFGQYHLPFGLYVSPTQEKWNHSIGHWSLSQPIISPYETCSQRQ